MVQSEGLSMWLIWNNVRKYGDAEEGDMHNILQNNETITHCHRTVIFFISRSNAKFK